MLKKDGFILTDKAADTAKKTIESMVRGKRPDFGNAREIRRFFEEITRRQAERVSALFDKQSTSAFLNTIEADDISESVKQISIDDVLADLDSMVGMKDIKETVRSIANKIAYNKKIMEQTGKAPDGEGNNICITGNPGTGKTTIVRTLAKLFKAIDLLSDDKPLAILGEDLKGSYLGQSKDKVNEYCRQAMGRVLFIDEAYNLVNKNGPVDQFANEAITVLLAHLENARDKFVCIVAGYQKEMDIFIEKSNPGMKRRFKHYIKLPDYSADELIEIFERFNVQKAGFSLTDAAKEKAREAIRVMVANKGPTFGNAGDIRTFFENVTSNTGNRVSKLPEDQQSAVLQIIEAEDIP
jgi:SpoVK/Ycf46/Vps4 family AAA+-type ATPase